MDSTFVRMKQDGYVGSHRPSNDFDTEGNSSRDKLTGEQCNEVKEGIEVVGIGEVWILIRWVCFWERSNERLYKTNKNWGWIRSRPEGWVIGIYATEGLADQAARESIPRKETRLFQEWHEVSYSTKVKGGKVRAANIRRKRAASC